MVLSLCGAALAQSKTGAATSSDPNGDGKPSDATTTRIGSPRLDTKSAPTSGFSISVDGERIAGDKPASIDVEHKIDRGLAEVDIQVKFDGLDQKPMLNVSTADMRRTYKAGAPVDFVATSNYQDWLTRQEVLVYPRDKQYLGKVAPIVVPVSEDGKASWTMPSNGPDEFEYVLRVYDREGRFDETLPLSVARTEKDLQGHRSSDVQPVAPGRGDERTALRNIPVYGGAVTVYGRNVPPGYVVRALGENIPVDDQKSFVVQRILPPGEHVVNVALHSSGPTKDGGLSFDREINIPSNDWFYVGLADVTVGRRSGDAGIEAVRDNEYDKTYTNGRAAFYLKGKVKGQYLLTAAADTKGNQLKDVFRNLDAKDARSFLNRINPEQYYPVYGDDSTAFEDAPTRGKFYVRLEKGESRVMWGNFKSRVSGAKLLRNERALYGASAVYKSEEKTSFGESKVQAEGYAASAETIPTREVLGGTAGSAYALKYQDVVVGSETISIQFRDPVSNRVIRTQRLSAGTDYTMDSLQGYVLLKRPISLYGQAGVAGEGTVKQFLVVQYERTPAVGDISGTSYGGRVQGWLDEKLRLGATGMNEAMGQSNQKMAGLDLVLRHSATTFLEAEVAETKGPGFKSLWSYDGGYTHGSPNADFDNVSGRKARAYSLKGELDLADVSQGKVKGVIGAFYEKKEAGFSSLDFDIGADQRVVGTFADLKLNEQTTLGFKYEDYADKANNGGQSKRDGAANLEYMVDEYWKTSIGVRHVGVDNLRGSTRNNDHVTWNGERTDLGARLTYSPTIDTSIYALGQATVAKSGNLRRNDRIGVGAETRLTDAIKVNGEITRGTAGWGALAGVTYEPNADHSYYMGYSLDPSLEFDLTRLGGNVLKGDGGTFVAGARHRYNDMWSAFTETNTDLFGRRRSLASTYGVSYTPDDLWTLTGGLERGWVEDDLKGNRTGQQLSNFRRFAPSLGVGYKDGERLTANIKLEGRFENSQDNTRDQTSYYLASGMSVKVSDDWRALANVDAVLSKSDQLSIRNGNYVEASLGAAYRPVANDRFNGLFKYVFVLDEPGAEQVSAIAGGKNGPRQRSHILSVDGIYDLNQYLSVGAKYGLRIGQTSMRELNAADGFVGWGDWRDNIAQLGVLRADFHVVKNWDVMLEGRVLRVDTQGLGHQTDFGSVAAVYRHFGDNLKAGVGYNFGRFSDNLKDQTLDDKGVFLNVVGKF